MHFNIKLNKADEASFLNTNSLHQNHFFSICKIQIQGQVLELYYQLWIKYSDRKLSRTDQEIEICKCNEKK